MTTVAAGEGLRHELAHARIWWAQQGLARGERDAAREQLLAACQQIDTLGAEPLRPLAKRVAAEGRVWLRPPKRSASVLTAREGEVLHLVAQGRTNRAIADALFISPKTASVHVSNTLAKVGATTRTEAAAWAHQHNPATTGPARAGRHSAAGALG